MANDLSSEERRDIQDCITDCKACHDICLITIHHCLRVGGRHAEQPHVRLIADCVELCQTCANFMLRGSDQSDLVCQACAEICERCAADCARFSDDVQMRACVEACHRCAASCRTMSGGLVSGGV